MTVQEDVGAGAWLGGLTDMEGERGSDPDLMIYRALSLSLSLTPSIPSHVCNLSTSRIIVPVTIFFIWTNVLVNRSFNLA